MRTLQGQQRYTRLLSLIIVMTAVALLIGALALHYVENRLVATEGQNLALAAAELADKLDLLLSERYNDIRGLSHAPILRRRDVPAKSAFLDRFREINPIYLWLGMTDAQGRIVVATDPATVGEDRSRSPWFRAARDKGEVHVGDVEPFEEAGGIDSISFTAPLRGLQGEFLGAMTTRVGLPILEDAVARTIRAFRTREDFAGTIEYQFLTDKGDAFIDSDLLHKGSVNLKRLGLPSALLSESGRPGYVGEEHLRRHVPVITGYAKTKGRGEFPGLKWTVLLRMDQSDVLMPIRKVLWTLGTAGILVGIPLFGLLLWATGRLRKEWALAQEEHARTAAAESRYSALLESTGEGICGMDQEGRLTFINGAGAVKLGYLPTELLGRRIHDVIHHSHPDGSPYPFEQCPVVRMLRTGQGCVLENEVLWHKDGTSFPAKYSAYPIEEDGQINGAVVIFSDITERKTAEENLRESERFLRQAQQVARMGSWHWDIHPNVVTWSDSLYHLFGLRPGETVTFEVFLSLVHPDDRVVARATVESSLRNDSHYSGEFRAVRPDGTVWWCHSRGEVIRDSARSPIALIGVAQDISDRKHWEEALQERARLSSFAADVSFALNQGLSTEEILRHCVEAAVRHLGAALARIWTVEPGDLCEECHKAAWCANRAQCLHLKASAGLSTNLNGEYRRVPLGALKIGRIAQGEGVMFTNDVLGDERLPNKDWLQQNGLRSFAGFPLIMEGKVFGVMAVFARVLLSEPTLQTLESICNGIAATLARKRGEERLRESEERFRKTFDDASIGMVMVGRDYRFIRVNQALCDMLGYARDELTRKTFLDITHPEDKELGLDMVQQASSGTINSFELEKRYLRKDRSVVRVHLTVTGIRDHDGKHLYNMAMLEDITERKRAEKALQESERALREALKEREQLGQDLHDGLVQSLYAIGMSMEECQRLMEEDAEKTRLKLGQTIGDLNAVIREVRQHLIESEDGMPFGAGKFKAELMRIARTMERANALHFRLKVDPRAAERLTIEERREILYIAQEAMSNSLRHSSASIAHVSLRLERECVRLEVEDDGIGFDKQAARERSSGIQNIERRAAKIGAKLQLVSQREHGTRVSLDMPIHHD